MFKVTNDNRADWADNAIMTFARETGMISNQNYEENETILSDLLCDIMHWCDKHQIDFGSVCEGAKRNHVDEVAEEIADEE